MAVIGDFSKLLNFLKTNKNHPLIKLSIDDVDKIKSYEDFSKIKPLNKSELSKLQQKNPPFNNLLDLNKITKIFQSPGPIYNAKGKDFEHYRFYKALEKAGFTENDIVINTFSYHISPAGEMFDDAIKKIGAVSFPLGPTTSEQAAEFAVNIGATALIGTRTFLLKILEHDDNLKINKAYLIAEKLTEDDRKLFKDKFGVIAFQGYGTAELGLIATEDKSFNGMIVDADSIFLEILEPLSNQPVNQNDMGEVVITFMNETTPFVRLATGDLSYIHRDFSDRIAGIFGRADNSIKIKGVFVHFWQLEEFANDLDIRINLISDTDDNGMDYLKLKVSKELASIEEKFKKTFGLKLSKIEIDDKIEKTEIIEKRKRLKEQ